MSAKPTGITWTPHPVLRVPTREQLAALTAGKSPEEALATVRDLHARRERAIEAEKHDPLRHGYEPETFKKARELIARYDEVYLMGGNREGKTTFAVKFAVEDLVTTPGRLWAFFHSSEQSSIRQQQGKVHDMLPPEWRDCGKVGSDIYVKYSRQNGFSGAQFILPNGSTGMFFNYKQDPDVLEGYELDGVWFDELVPLEFIETMAFRVGRGRTLKKLITFTPKNGFTPTVGRAILGAQVVETRAARLLAAETKHHKDCPPGHLPYVMAKPGTAILFFHLGLNPYGASKEVERELLGKPVKMVKERAYGWADKLVATAFPKYGAVHRITREEWARIEAGGVTRYCVADPGGTKNWFIKWYAVTPQGWVIVYREWPDAQRYGEWALPPEKAHSLDWRTGEAQRVDAGAGMTEYRRRILEAEGWVWDEARKLWDGAKAEKIATRLIDPRMGSQGMPGQDEGTSIIDLMAEVMKDPNGHVTMPPMYWEEAPASGVQESVQLLQSAMDYDQDAPVNVLNCPRWYHLDDLAQTQLAYQEFTGLGTQKDALKDIIDPDRYFIKADLGYMDPQARRVSGGGYY
jgi:hypothetical protein